MVVGGWSAPVVTSWSAYARTSLGSLARTTLSMDPPSSASSTQGTQAARALADEIQILCSSLCNWFIFQARVLQVDPVQGRRQACYKLSFMVLLDLGITLVV